jgi:ketosteroid isomerase-like protein
MADTELTARVAALEEKDEVRAAIAEYCAFNDRLTSLDELIGLFAEDAVLLNPTGEHIGRHAIDRFYRGFFDGTTEFARHHTMNQVIEIIEPGVARHRSYFIAFLGRQGESKIAFGQYDDLLAKTPDGWKFTRKINDVVGVTTADAGWAQGFSSTSAVR